MAIRTVFANESGNQPASQLDNMYGDVWNAATIPCSVTGTNALTLTPMTNANQPTAYNQHQRVSFTAGNTSTGSVTAALGSLGALNIYLPGGQQAGANAIFSGSYYEFAYDAALNSGGGGWWLVTATNTSTIRRLNLNSFVGASAFTDITSLINPTCTIFKVVGRNIQFTNNAVNLSLLFSTNGGSSYDSTAGHYSVPVAVFTAAPASSSGVFTSRAGLNSATIGSGQILSFEFTLFNPAGSNNTFIQGQSSYSNSTGPVQEMIIFGGAYTFANVVNAIQILPSAGTFTGTIEVFGLL